MTVTNNSFKGSVPTMENRKFVTTLMLCLTVLGVACVMFAPARGGPPDADAPADYAGVDRQYCPPEFGVSGRFVVNRQTWEVFAICENLQESLAVYRALNGWREIELNRLREDAAKGPQLPVFGAPTPPVPEDLPPPPEPTPICE